MNKALLVSLCVLPLFACGGGGSESSTTPSSTSTQDIIDNTNTSVDSVTTYTGIFVDSAVEGLSYSTESQSGITNEKGEFTYQLEENVIFSIGGINFPATPVKNIITPLDMFNTSNINTPEVVNVLRLLQSLDTDGLPENGIQISEQVRELAELVTVDFTSNTFEQVVESLVQMSGNVHQQLITEDTAIYHFQTTLTALNIQHSSQCEKTHSSVGYYGYFSTLAHDVSGRAEIIDDCTIKITAFNYDGGGPLVYFYGATNHDYVSDDAFSVGEKINGTTFENSEIILTLPNNKTLDDLNGLSVWCADFNANFGQISFSP